MEILVPTEARTSKTKVGDLKPIDAYYTAGYGCVTGAGTRMGPTMTYKFRGKDLGLDYDVLVRTANPNPFANFKYRADRIVGDNKQTHPTSEGKKEVIVYELQELPTDVQAKIFEAMKVDWESEKLVEELMTGGLAH